MKTLKNYLGLFAALGACFVLSALPVSQAQAAGYYTNGLPADTAAQMQGPETFPLDTNYAGGASPQTAAITATELRIWMNGGPTVLGTAVSNAVTAQGVRLNITTEALTTAAGATYTLTITDASISATSIVFVTVGLGSSTTGTPALTTVTPGAGSVVIIVQNIHATAALNGTLKIGVRVM